MKSGPRTPESFIFDKMPDGYQFITMKADKDIQAIASNKKRKATTERVIITRHTWQTPECFAAVLVTLGQKMQNEPTSNP